MDISLSARTWKDYFSATQRNDLHTDNITHFSDFFPVPELNDRTHSSKKHGSNNLEAYALPLIQLPATNTQKKPATTNSSESKERRKQQQKEK